MNALDPEKILSLNSARTPGPWAWQKFGGVYYLVGQYGPRPVILGPLAPAHPAAKDPCERLTRLANRDASGELVTLDPSHPDSAYIEAACEQAPLLAAEVVRLREEVAKLQAFKDWVHNYLDAHGVPHHPPGVHGPEGCRIGDRMDWLMHEIARRDKEAEETRAWIEERAGERHLLHSSLGKEDRFWNCTKAPCQTFAAFLRGLARWHCRARAAGTAGGNDPQECDWPFCYCDPVASRVLETIEESGLEIIRKDHSAEARILQLEAQLFKTAEWLLIEKSIAQEGMDNPGAMGEAFRERVATIDALLDGSAGESKLCDLMALRDRLYATVEAQAAEILRLRESVGNEAAGR